jgi:hypothetical protein
MIQPFGPLLVLILLGGLGSIVAGVMSGASTHVVAGATRWG